MPASRLEAIKKGITALPAEELTEFRKWFARFDTAERDRQSERDAESGKLEKLWKDEAQRRLDEIERGDASSMHAHRALAQAHKK